MSQMQPPQGETLTEQCGRFVDLYCQQAVDAAQTGGIPTIKWSNLYEFDADLARDYLDNRDEIHPHIQQAVVGAAPTGADSSTHVRVVDIPEQQTFSPMELRKESSPGYVAVEGDLAKVTTPQERPSLAAFECKRCGAMMELEQYAEELREPHECDSCERKGPFELRAEDSEWEDYVKARIQTPPDERGDLQDEHVDAHIRGDMVWQGHDKYGLTARTGDRVTAYGEIKRVQRGDSAAFDREFVVHGLEFDSEDDQIQIDEHREHFEAHANGEDPISTFAQSIAPGLHVTPEWETALDLLVAYLFGAPRIDTEEETFRGDVHALIISDYGMSKSKVFENVAQYSPDCISESVTGMSSEVGLLAAAVEDDFGDSQWTLEPGVLVRGNGGHVILDEIDKTNADLERMNNALEGEQVVDVNKAGQSATYKSRCGLLAGGNPEGGRFDPHSSVAEQINIDPSLLSRFDGVVTMRDSADEEQDRQIATAIGESVVEGQRKQQDDDADLDRLDRPVSVDVGRAWVAYARQEIDPTVTQEHVEQIAEWYASEVRTINEQITAGEADAPVPTTARCVTSVLRMAAAFARCELCEQLQEHHIERAKKRKKELMGQNYDGDTFAPDAVRAHQAQERLTTNKDVDQAIQAVCSGEDAPLSVADIQERVNANPEKVEHRIENLAERGVLYQPETGVYRNT
jgi:replicative DNA helicase Mcm